MLVATVRRRGARQQQRGAVAAVDADSLRALAGAIERISGYEENDTTEEEVTREGTTRVGRPRGGMKVAARVGERLRREKRRTPKRLAHHTPLLKIPVWWRRAVLPSLP